VVGAQSTQPYWYSATKVKPPKKGKHFLHLDDFSREELLDMLEKGKLCKVSFIDARG
jgi:ornithine carbamoyltransferase